MPRKTTRRPRSSKRPAQVQVRSTQQVSPKATPMFQTPSSWDPANFDVPQLPKPKKHQICNIVRTFTVAQLSANTGDTVNAFYFTLSNLPNYTDFTNLFDAYRVLQIVYSFASNSTAVASTAVGASYPGIIGTWLDYDDAALPANLAEGQQFESYQRNNACYDFHRVVNPCSALAAYSGAFTSYATVYGQWHQTSSPNVQHYGLKSVITGSTFATSTKIYEIEASVHLQFRSVK